MIRHPEPLEPAEAAGRISHAIDLTDDRRARCPTTRTCSFHLRARSSLDSHRLHRPIRSRPPMTNASNSSLSSSTLTVWAAAIAGLEDDPGSIQQIGEFCELFIDYSEGYAGGDIHRWSPMVVEGFLHFYGVKVMSDPDTDELPEPVPDRVDRLLPPVEGVARVGHRRGPGGVRSALRVRHRSRRPRCHHPDGRPDPPGRGDGHRPGGPHIR